MQLLRTVAPFLHARGVAYQLVCIAPKTRKLFMHERLVLKTQWSQELMYDMGLIQPSLRDGRNTKLLSRR